LVVQERSVAGLFIPPDGIQHIDAQPKALSAELFKEGNDGRNYAEPPRRHEDTYGANNVQTQSAGQSARRPVIDHNHICAALLREAYDLSLASA
jgi:hypothetical protein